MSSQQSISASRRDFLKATSTLTAGAILGGWSMVRNAHAAGSDELRVGLIGCGGRGSGAAINALRADPSAKLVAMGDLFADRIAASLPSIIRDATDFGAQDRVDVPTERRFGGFDAYQQVIDSGVDVVLLTTPPHFRPAHFKAAVAAGKHCFVEKPVAVDAPGLRSVLATCGEAKEKNLSIISGLCWRYDLPKQQAFARVHDGAIGEIRTMEVNYLGGTLGYNGRDQKWSDMEWQIRNWLTFVWLSGDHNVEQHVHSLDKAAWAMKDEPPVKCSGMGGREMRNPEIGNCYDHFAVTYEYAGGQKLFARCRQMDGCKGDISDYLIGTKGACAVMENRIDGENKWRYRGEVPNMYDREHLELFKSIRNSNPINNGLYMCQSTLMAIMGRMAAYTGQEITWEQAMASQEDLSPTKYDWESAPSVTIAKPGITLFV